MNRFVIILLLTLINVIGLHANKKNFHLENEKIIVDLDESGIKSMYDRQSGSYLHFKCNLPIFSIDGIMMNLDNKTPSLAHKNENYISYLYKLENFEVEVKYELGENWRFISRQIFFNSRGKEAYKVNLIKIFEGNIEEDIEDHLALSRGNYGIFLRLKQAKYDNEGFGCFMTVQNPFSEYRLQGNNISISYSPEMEWKQSYGSFASDRLCIGFNDLTGHTFRYSLLPEWEYVKDPVSFLKEGKHIDQGEIEALTQCAREFLLFDPKESVRVHIGWCENDYQIDISTAEGMKEYKRIIDRAADVGCEHVLFTPSNSEVSSLKENTDAWGWENLLWWGLGQKIRKDEWHPGDPLPSTVQEVREYAVSKKLGLMAYVYPSLPFMQNPEWTAWRTSNGKKPEGYLTVDTGLRSFQDWFVDLLVSFAEKTGCTGYSFDYWWIAYENDSDNKNVKVSSKYQQWYGCRRILEQLRKRAPHLVIDGRQQYHHFGTWTWLSGTYPHPMMSDEQPGSFIPITDLSTDRINGARQRYVAYRLMTNDFTPSEILPGFITHQTQRNDADGVMRRDRFRTRDWDYSGWKYNLISSIATAPYNHVINYLPARDEEEFNAFSQEDKLFFNRWLDFTDENMEYLKKRKPILGQPMLGKCDGTSAIVHDRGYVFIFNPNYREIGTEFVLNQSIGLTTEKKFILTEIYPRNGVILDPGIMTFGDTIKLNMMGTSARVLKIEPYGEIKEPLLINAPGNVCLENNNLCLTEVYGVVGSKEEITVILPKNINVKLLTVNGKETKFYQEGNKVKATLRFAGEYFPQSAGFTKYDPEFAGSVVETSLRIPERIFKQLEKRKKVWPVNYTEDDKLAPWLEPSRLLLYIQVADPYREVEEERWENDATKRRVKRPIGRDEYQLEIDGQPYQLQEAYNGVYPYMERTYLGVYADISSLKPDIEHRIKVKLPSGLEAGQFQGIFIDHVENEYSGIIMD